MADYQKMYQILFKASEEAVNLLISAQRECEEIYISTEGPNLTLLPVEDDDPI